MTTSLQRPFLAALAFALMATAIACPSKNNDAERPGTTGGAAASKGDLDMSVTINAADPDNNRQASVKLDPGMAIPGGQLSFELPAECQIVAGAAVRTLTPMTPGTAVSQELKFQCPAGQAGVLKVTFKGADGTGKVVEGSAEGSF